MQDFAVDYLYFSIKDRQPLVAVIARGVHSSFILILLDRRSLAILLYTAADQASFSSMVTLVLARLEDSVSACVLSSSSLLC